MVMGLLLVTHVAVAEQRIYQTDKYGNVMKHLPSYTIENNGRIVETDKFGNKQYQKDQWLIQGDKIYQTDKYGNIQHHKPSMSVKIQ
jgi:uncharacterized protein YycO